MSSYIDVKFINLLSTRLPKFKRKSEYLFNFRCPHCGDSQKSQTKARGFVYKKKNDMFFKCHNCGVGQSLGNLIKFLDPNLYKEYIFERFKDGKPTKDKPEFDFTPSKILKTKTADEKLLDQLDSFDNLDAKGDVNSIQLAINGLKAAYDNSQGYEGRMLSGKAPQTSGDVYRSQAEVVKAMSHPDYDNDPAYRQDVIDKLARSNVSF